MSQKKVAVGAVVFSVGPNGKPNAHSARIGRGRVISLHQEVDGLDGALKNYAYVAFFDGKRGSWPVERLAVV
jgi:hypothetical protein